MESEADATEIWAPALETEAPPILHLPDDPERMIGFTPGVTREMFLERAKGGPVTHPATVARRYRDAKIFAGSIYTRSSFTVISDAADRSSRILWRGAPMQFGERLFATNYVNERYFGHWLLDGLSLELLAKERGVAALGLAREPWRQEPEYRARTGLALDRTGFAHVDDLWMIDDRAMNGSRMARMAELRRRVRGSTPPAPGAPVFLLRVGGARRMLHGQLELADALARRGFTILTPEEETIETLRTALAGARLVVSVEGSALCHAAAAMADGGTILAIQPPRRVDWIQKVWADCAGLHLAQTVADDRPDGFFMPEDRLLRLCDLIARERSF